MDTIQHLKGGIGSAAPAKPVEHDVVRSSTLCDLGEVRKPLVFRGRMVADTWYMAMKNTPIISGAGTLLAEVSECALSPDFHRIFRRDDGDLCFWVDVLSGDQQGVAGFISSSHILKQKAFRAPLDAVELDHLFRIANDLQFWDGEGFRPLPHCHVQGGCVDRSIAITWVFRALGLDAKPIYLSARDRNRRGFLGPASLKDEKWRFHVATLLCCAGQEWVFDPSLANTALLFEMWQGRIAPDFPVRPSTDADFSMEVPGRPNTPPLSGKGHPDPIPWSRVPFDVISFMADRCLRDPSFRGIHPKHHLVSVVAPPFFSRPPLLDIMGASTLPADAVLDSLKRQSMNKCLGYFDG